MCHGQNMVYRMVIHRRIGILPTGVKIPITRVDWWASPNKLYKLTQVLTLWHFWRDVARWRDSPSENGWSWHVQHCWELIMLASGHIIISHIMSNLTKTLHKSQLNSPLFWWTCPTRGPYYSDVFGRHTSSGLANPILLHSHSHLPHLVGGPGPPLWKIGLRQLGWWDSQY